MYCCLQSIFAAVRGAVMWGGLDFSFFSFFSFCTEHNAYTVFSLSGGLWGRPNSTLAQKTRSCGGMELRGGGAGKRKTRPCAPTHTRQSWNFREGYAEDRIAPRFDFLCLSLSLVTAW